MPKPAKRKDIMETFFKLFFPDDMFTHGLISDFDMDIATTYNGDPMSKQETISALLEGTGLSVMRFDLMTMKKERAVETDEVVSRDVIDEETTTYEEPTIMLATSLPQTV